ncbi:hypothetical protein JJL45_05185 [Tamlana sp. s12]|uniref:hypothetical protein n=1 Tax=Tamlana sp. s12 TaxID=1630406 RepID=UPI0007FFB618|nr:hypothetical protein [Tamlana sp. s12]OBQ56102.1 hypothetical protein VQ01_06875 [Tamlana sp. s12]QQY83385.1 hypothetical protein JJL45_05185 [Tamlana sp. s12]
MLEKRNRKHPSQKSKTPLQPSKKAMRKATIVIMPDEEIKVDIKTGNVSDIEMVQYLRDMTKHFANVIINDATEVVGDNDEERAKYIDWRISQSGIGK